MRLSSLSSLLFLPPWTRKPIIAHSRAHKCGIPAWLYPIFMVLGTRSPSSGAEYSRTGYPLGSASLSNRAWLISSTWVGKKA